MFNCFLDRVQGVGRGSGRKLDALHDVLRAEKPAKQCLDMFPAEIGGNFFESRICFNY